MEKENKFCNKCSIFMYGNFGLPTESKIFPGLCSWCQGKIEQKCPKFSMMGIHCGKHATDIKW